MFPTLSSLIEYFTGVRAALPVQTYGLFVALAFWLSYMAFKSEFFRKEKLGLIHPFKRKTPSPLVRISSRIGGILLSFFTGYKIYYCVRNYELFVLNPQQFVFSFKGDVVGGFIGVAILLIIWWWMKWQSKDDEDIIHPYQHTDRMLLWCACCGFVGAILFAKLEYIDVLFKDPVAFFTTNHGMAFLGGFIFGAGIYFIRTTRMKIPFLVAADIGSPGMLLAPAVGRMGCHLSGDGDWGQVNYDQLPSLLSWLPDWSWAYKYPHNSIHAGIYIEGCSGSYCTELKHPVYPTSLYESLICLLMFASLWAFRHRIKTNGMMFFIFLLCLGTERFLMEFIRLNKQYCVADICLTQAQYISLVFMVIGGLGIVSRARMAKA